MELPNLGVLNPNTFRIQTDYVYRVTTAGSSNLELADYTPKISFEPNFLVVDTVFYKGTAADAQLYRLVSDLCSSSANHVTSVFEGSYFKKLTYKLDRPIRNQTFKLWLQPLDPAQTTKAGSFLLELSFIYIPPLDDGKKLT